MIGRLLGRYRIVEQIGAGGMGVVYRARDEGLHRDVAIKILPPGTIEDEAARRQLRSEALAVAKLNHSNIAMALDFGHEQGVDFLVTEYIPGVTLDEKLHTSAPLPEKLILDLGAQLMTGLEVAHREGIIHRDLKPGNLRLRDDGTLKILDFGLAKVIGTIDATGSTITLGGSRPFKGTMPYMSPEQVRSEPADQRSDIWSAGAVLYEMATGKRAFPQKIPAEIMDAVRHEDPVEPRALNPKISTALETVIFKALDKDPDRRYQTAREMHVDLNRIVAGNASTVGSRHQSKINLNRRARDRWRPWMLGVIVLLGAVAGYLLYRNLPPWRPGRQQIMAVLPFETPGQDEATGALSRGLSDTVTAKLVQASNTDTVQVVSPRELRDAGVKTADDARREFGTDMVLEGTLERSGSMIRINCFLVDSKTRRQLGARTITVADTDSFGLQDQVVSEVLDLLPMKLRPEERQELATTQNTNPAAYEAYIRGRGYLLDYEKSENIDSAIAEFERAIRLDSKYGPAYASLGEAYWIGYQELNKGKLWLDAASENCRKALTLRPETAEAHACFGNIDYGTGKYADAVKQYQRALDLDRNNDYALGQLADAYQKLGNPTAAEAAYKKAISLRPQYWGVYSGLGALYFSQARYADAADAFLKVTSLSPDNHRGYSNLGAAYLYLGKYPEAIDSLRRSIELRPNRDAYTALGSAYFSQRRFAEAVGGFQLALGLDDTDPLNWGNLADALYWTPGKRLDAPAAYQNAIKLFRSKLKTNPNDAEALGYLAMYSAMLGDRHTAKDSLKRSLELASNAPDGLFYAAFVYNQFGDPDTALEWLRKAISAGYSKSQVKDNPFFDNLNKNPSFQKMVAD
jgi:serine/threonine-protein kinase